MKILKYGPLRVEVNLDPPGEEIFMDQLKEIIKTAESDYRWRQQNAGGAYSQITKEEKGIIPKGHSNTPLKSIVKKSGNKNKKVKM